ncbi:CRAL-TRIO lipid binding domain [Trinorchestia longiramus]|nr:CRAL-TRIO lipid binding domain [Trinorchestia longiramus]
MIQRVTLRIQRVTVRIQRVTLRIQRETLRIQRVRYLLSRLEQLVSDDYILVYLSGGRNISSTGPSFHWLKTAYHLIDRKLKKNLRALLVVHPTLWVRTIVALTRPFISSKFYRKLTFVYSLTELAQLLPLDQLDIPDAVKEADFQMMAREKKRSGGRRGRPTLAPH